VGRMMRTERGQFVRGESSIAEKDEFSVREPVEEGGHQLAGQAGGRLVSAVLRAVECFGAVERTQHRQGPTPRGEGELYRQSQDHPAMAPPPHDVTTTGADGVVMASLAVDVFAPVLGCRIIHGHKNRFVGRGGTARWQRPEPCPGATSATTPG
jgi:hypothetical protein